jgi:hypothetical protein
MAGGNKQKNQLRKPVTRGNFNLKQNVIGK